MTPRYDTRINRLSDIVQIVAGPVMIDTCLLFSGITRRTNSGFSFTDIQSAFLDVSLSRLQNILLHEAVLKELENSELHAYILKRVGLNIHIVSEEGRYGTDPRYTLIFDSIARHFTFRYIRSNIDLMQCPCKNRGEIASLAYAAYHSIPFIGTCDQGCYIVQEDLPELKKIKIFGSEVLLYFGFDRAYINSETIKRIKALYKYLCAAQIKRGKLPATFKEYLDLLTRVN
jgi:hypothetical protein